MAKPKIINSTSIGNTRRDNTKVVVKKQKQYYTPKTVKEFYFQDVKPNIDKALTNPKLVGVPAYFYKPDFDARNAKTQDEAYKMARSTGAKTFIWNGKHYNTDYKGNPNKTLVQQKQEELDTYGITNEQTQNKNLISQRLHDNLFPGGYQKPVERVFDAVVMNNKEKYKSENANNINNSPRQDLFNLILGYPQKSNTVKISNYKPTNSKQEYYYALNDTGNPLNEKASSNGYNYIDHFTSKMKNNSNDVAVNGQLGSYTIGKTKDYLSYYDEWDINPFGKGNDEPLYQLGKPLNIYDRKYFDKDENMKINKTDKKPKYFLGAILGGAQLAMGAINMIQQNKMQKEQVSKENALVAEQDALAMKQKLDIEDVNQRNFGVNTPMHNFYANGGVKPTATNISTVVGPKHEQGGVDYKNAEVEGGEVIKHEGSNDFIFTDDMRIPFDDKHTYAEVSKQLSDDKGMLEKMAGAELLKHDKFIAKLNKSGSVTEASTNKRKAEVAKFKADAIDKDVSVYDSKLEELKMDQLQKGMALGLYNEDGIPKDTKGEFRKGGYYDENGNWVIDNLYTLQTPSLAKSAPTPKPIGEAFDLSYTGDIDPNRFKPEIKESFLAKANNFMGSNQGQAIMGLANAGLNLASNIATSKNMAKLKTPSYIPLTVQDTPLANLSATRQSIEESSDEQSKYATENFSNPQVAAIMKAKIEADKIENLGKVNQQEQTVNLDITNANISRRMGVEQANNQGLQQKQMIDYQKASADINNASNITAALTKDFGDVITNYRKGVMEDKTMDLYGKSFAGAVTDELRAAIADNVDLQKVREMTQDEALQYFANLGVYDKSKISNYLKYAKK